MLARTPPASLAPQERETDMDQNRAREAHGQHNRKHLPRPRLPTRAVGACRGASGHAVDHGKGYEYLAMLPRRRHTAVADGVGAKVADGVAAL